jgi:hypothetical protein
MSSNNNKQSIEVIIIDDSSCDNKVHPNQLIIIDDSSCDDDIIIIDQKDNKIRETVEIVPVPDVSVFNQITTCSITTHGKKHPYDAKWISKKRKNTEQLVPSKITDNKKRKIFKSDRAPKKLNYIFDVLYDVSTAKMCIDQYDDLELSNSTNVYENLKDTLIRVVEQKLWNMRTNSSTIKCWDNTYKIGDIVNVTYLPYSQRYMEYYDLQSFTGRIIFIDSIKDNAFFLIDNPCNNNITIKSLEREGCHFMGMSRGYDYIIESNNL